MQNFLIVAAETLLEFATRIPIDDKPVSFQITDWRQTGDKPLPKPTIVNLIETYTPLGLDELNSFAWHHKET